MSGPTMVLVFGVACATPCTATLVELEHIEHDVVRLLASRAITVKPAPVSAQRPTGKTASPEVADEAAKYDVDRVLVLDLEAGEHVLWLTHFVRGVVGPWSVGQVACARGTEASTPRLDCPELERVLASGLRPRKAEDVDFVSALRYQATRVGACVREEDLVPLEHRIFGRVELDLEALPSGHVHVVAVAPALVARSPLGQCLREAMESMNVGAFEGDAVRFRVPIDLD